MTFERFPLHRIGLFAIIITVFFASTLAIGQSEFLVYSFPNHGSPLPHGCLPQGNLVADSAGNLYGITGCGGSSNFGTVYELLRPVPPKKQWIQSVLYSFKGGSDGASPMSGLTIDSAGNLYGTTNTGGGTLGDGTVFELSPPVSVGGPWTESILYSFQGGDTGKNPGAAGVVLDGAGNLYGVTRMGGHNVPDYCNATGCGVIYKLAPPAVAGGDWTETVLHYFNGAQGTNGVGTPIFDGKGNLYGMAESGTVYRLSPPAIEGGAWIYAVLYNIGNSAGLSNGSLTFHNEGRLYGIATSGQFDLGSIFELVPPTTPGGTWSENILHSFAGGSDGIVATALGNVVFDKAGNLYGATYLGGGEGSCNPNTPGCGTVFELSPPVLEGGDWTETILHTFGAVATDGEETSGGLIFAKDGVLFGATFSGGTGGQGTVYGVVP